MEHTPEQPRHSENRVFARLRAYARSIRQSLKSLGKSLGELLEDVLGVLWRIFAIPIMIFSRGLGILIPNGWTIGRIIIRAIVDVLKVVIRVLDVPFKLLIKHVLDPALKLIMENDVVAVVVFLLTVAAIVLVIGLTIGVDILGAFR